MELEQYLRILRTHWIAVTVAVLLGAAAAFAFSALQTPMYAASSAGFVTSGAGGDPGLDNLNDTLSKSRAASYLVLAKDRETASIAARALGLETSPGALVGQIEVSQPPDTVIIQITARATSPEGAKELADAWVRALAQRIDDIETDGQRRGQGGMRIEVSETAELPGSPVSPNIPRNVLLGAVLGGLLGFGYAVGRSILDRRIRSAADVERDFDVPVVGTIPDIGSGAGLIVADSTSGPSAAASEGYRRLRTNLSYMDVDHPPRAIVITSPRQGDGKSTTAVNLAAAIALSGQDVTLVDGDLRRPNLAPLLSLDDTTGLTDVLAGRVKLSDALQDHAQIEGLKVLTSGTKPPNPSELLGSQAMRSLIGELAKQGYVIVDAPPLLPVTDAAILGHGADGALITISTGTTLDHELETALGHLSNTQARPLGVVLNKMSRKNVGAGYYGYDAYTEA
jgi:capsular exopolysaccharide synthesis family protein